ncbi:hypothetical protein [Methylobacterium sp. CM6244]
MSIDTSSLTRVTEDEIKSQDLHPEFTNASITDAGKRMHVVLRDRPVSSRADYGLNSGRWGLASVITVENEAGETVEVLKESGAYTQT